MAHQDARNRRAIGWSDDGETVLVRDTAALAELLPQYFKTRNYSSFVRQLNIHKFSKVKRKDGLNEFAHERFNRSRAAANPALDFLGAEGGEAGVEGEPTDPGELNAALKKRALELEEKIKMFNNHVTILIEGNKDLYFKSVKASTEHDVYFAKLVLGWVPLLTADAERFIDAARDKFANKCIRKVISQQGVVDASVARELRLLLSQKGNPECTYRPMVDELAECSLNWLQQRLFRPGEGEGQVRELFSSLVTRKHADRPEPASYKLLKDKLQKMDYELATKHIDVPAGLATIEAQLASNQLALERMRSTLSANSPEASWLNDL